MNSILEIVVKKTFEKRLKPLVIEQLRAELRGEVIEQLALECRQQAIDEIKKQVQEELRQSLVSTVRDEIEPSIREELKERLWAETSDKYHDVYCNDLWGQLRGELRPEVEQKLRQELEPKMKSQFVDELRSDMTSIEKTKLWKEAGDIAEHEFPKERWLKFTQELRDEIYDSTYEQFFLQGVESFLNFAGIEIPDNFYELTEEFIAEALEKKDKLPKKRSKTTQADGIYKATSVHVCAETKQLIAPREYYEVRNGLRLKLPDQMVAVETWAATAAFRSPKTNKTDASDSQLNWVSEE
jgi:hypothetical protein